MNERKMLCVTPVLTLSRTLYEDFTIPEHNGELPVSWSTTRREAPKKVVISNNQKIVKSTENASNSLGSVHDGG